MKNLENLKNKFTGLESKKTIMTVYTGLAIFILTPVMVYVGDLGPRIQGIMDILVELMAWGIAALGAFIAVFGVITYGQANSNDDAAGKNKAVMQIVGGVIIIVAAVVVGLVGAEFLQMPDISF